MTETTYRHTVTRRDSHRLPWVCNVSDGVHNWPSYFLYEPNCHDIEDARMIGRDMIEQLRMMMVD